MYAGSKYKSHYTVWTAWISIRVRVRVRVDFILNNLAPPGTTVHVPTARRKRSEAVSRETACQVLLSFTSEETNKPSEIETVGSRIVETGTMTETLGKDTETMTDLSMSDMQYLDALEKECNHLRSENVELKKSISTKFPCEETLDGDDEQVKFYTGLPTFVTLMAIFRFVSSHFGSSDTSHSLPHFQQFMYICMLP